MVEATTTQSSSQKTFFCQSIGPTIEVLSFYGVTCKVKALLKRLNKQTSQFYDKQEQNLFRQCKPSIFGGKVERLADFTNLHKAFVQKILHIRDDMFVLMYLGGLIEMRDLSNQSPDAQPIYTYQLPFDENDESMINTIDIDFKGDESRLMITLRHMSVVALNLRTGETKVISNLLENNPQNQSHGDWTSKLCQGTFIQQLPGNAFFTLTSGGFVYVFDDDIVQTKLSQSVIQSGDLDGRRPFSRAIELFDDASNVLGTTAADGSKCTLIASISLGSKMAHAVNVCRYFGSEDERNTFQRLRVKAGMNVHSLYQMKTRILAVSMDFHIELYDILSGVQTRIVETGGMYQHIVRVDPGMNSIFEMGDKFDQEVCIGYNYGSFYSLGLADTKQQQKSSQDVHMASDSQDEETAGDLTLLDKANMEMFQRVMDQDKVKTVANRKLLPKQLKATSICQVEGLTRQFGEEATFKNMLYLTPLTDEGTIIRIRLSIQ